jgi:serine/threonine protein kinase
VAPRVYRLVLVQKWQVYSRLRKEDMDLPVFDFSILVKATNNFSSINKLGEGGFGPVYKVIHIYIYIAIFDEDCQFFNKNLLFETMISRVRS